MLKLTHFFGRRRRKKDSDSLDGPPRFSLSLQVAASAVLLAVVLVSLTGWHLYHTYQLALWRSQNNILNLTQALSQHANDTFMQAELLLTDLAQRITHDGLDAVEQAQLHPLFTAKMRDLPQVRGIFLYDAAGRMVATSDAALPANTDFTDRDYYRYHRDHNDTQLHIGKVIRSRLSGGLILPVSLRINHPDGSCFAGVLLESVVIDYFRHFYARFVIDDDSTLMMMLNNGTVLYRHPYNERAIGSSISASPLYQQHIDQQTSGVMTGALNNHDPRKIYSFTHLQQFPVAITTGMSLNQALVDWRQDAISHVILVVIFLALLSLLAISFIRQIRSRMRVEEELRHAQRELRKLNQSLEHLARRDGLTGLYNRRHFDLALTDEFNRAVASHESLGIILLDIDFFKQYNDLYGHVAGDNCLKRIGEALKALPLRHRDRVARYGGEEFIILLPQTDAAGAREVAQRVYEAITGLAIRHQASPTGALTPSIGVYVGQPAIRDESPSRMVSRADTALYQAKGEGRNRICFA
ncbi:GGDEF domain-containing protein [Candidatus Sodalis sp. SoCistrobi]|uniref:sensor domain-containing diguanylate cyclase n=1 Tax=Candidatus Sodalis sp. SoCistrobi TaxID=1922216 RepID=UPI00093B4E7A|nr:GGDEF domain-containing protein [Candidatus Sodalis sp. SoCistrobi]